MKIIFLAPHARFPLRDAASIRSHEIACHLRSQGTSVTLLGKNEVIESSGLKETARRKISSDNNKFCSAWGAFWGRDHYLVHKHLTPAWMKSADWILRQEDFEAVIVSFLWTYPKLKKFLRGQRLLIDTHNFDPEWWSNFRRHTRNPVRHRLAKHAQSYIERVLTDLPESAELMHVSERDSRLYKKIRPDLRHYVLPNGCTPQPRICVPDYESDRKELYFLGLLSSQMSFDALDVFAKKFWPVLKDFCGFTVMGSDPNIAVKRLSHKQGWKTAFNLEESKITTLLESMHYLVLPFAYGAGSKLKLVDACGRGMPAVSTPSGVTGFPSLPDLLLVSESAVEWRDHIRMFRPARTAVEMAQEFGRMHSWQRLVEQFKADAVL